MTLRWGTKRRKTSHKLDHQQKREVAKDILSGMGAKQIAAKWHICLTQVYQITNGYTTMTRTEKYPDVHFELPQPTLFDWLESESQAAEPAE
jgi:hypothetical protein